MAANNHVSSGNNAPQNKGSVQTREAKAETTQPQGPVLSKQDYDFIEQLNHKYTFGG